MTERSEHVGRGFDHTANPAVDHMEPVSCGCGTTVFVEKYSEAHTSVQWPARTVCPQLVHDRSPGGWSPTCPSLRHAIDEACESGRIGLSVRHDPPPVRFGDGDAGIR